MHGEAVTRGYFAEQLARLDLAGFYPFSNGTNRTQMGFRFIQSI